MTLLGAHGNDELSPIQGVFLFVSSVLCVFIISGPTRAGEQTPTGDPTPPKALVSISDSQKCVATDDLTATLEESLNTFEVRDSEISIDVSIEPKAAKPSDFNIVLTVSREDQIGLVREYSMTSTDCRSLGQLLHMTLERFFTSFPSWRTPSPAVDTESPPTPVEDTTTDFVSSKYAEIVLFITPALELIPVNGSLDLGGRIDYGHFHRFGISILARQSLPAKLAGNRFLQTFGLVGIGWQYARYSFRPRLEILGGFLNTHGINFENNQTTWLFWVEARAIIEKRWSRIALGLDVAFSPMRHQAKSIIHNDLAVADEVETRKISWIRVGATLTVLLWTNRDER